MSQLKETGRVCWEVQSVSALTDGQFPLLHLAQLKCQMIFKHQEADGFFLKVAVGTCEPVFSSEPLDSLHKNNQTIINLLSRTGTFCLSWLFSCCFHVLWIWANLFEHRSLRTTQKKRNNNNTLHQVTIAAQLPCSCRNNVAAVPVKRINYHSFTKRTNFLDIASFYFFIYNSLKRMKIAWNVTENIF